MKKVRRPAGFRAGMRRRIYRDNGNGRWNGSHCPQCRYRGKPKYRYRPPKGGFKDVDLTGSPTQLKGRVSERIAARALSAFGFKNVKLNPYIHGPDITFDLLPDLNVTVEVKSAVKYTRHGKYTFWLSEPVRKTRQADDLILIILPGGVPHLEIMREHLSKCRKDGRRNLMPLIKRVL